MVGELYRLSLDAKGCEDIKCDVCMRGREENLLLCERCTVGRHTECCSPPLDSVPDDDWFCSETCRTQSHDSMLKRDQIGHDDHGKGQSPSSDDVRAPTRVTPGNASIIPIKPDGRCATRALLRISRGEARFELSTDATTLEDIKLVRHKAIKHIEVCRVIWSINALRALNHCRTIQTKRSAEPAWSASLDDSLDATYSSESGLRLFATWRKRMLENDCEWSNLPMLVATAAVEHIKFKVWYSMPKQHEVLKVWYSMPEQHEVTGDSEQGGSEALVIAHLLHCNAATGLPASFGNGNHFNLLHSPRRLSGVIELSGRFLIDEKCRASGGFGEKYKRREPNEIALTGVYHLTDESSDATGDGSAILEGGLELGANDSEIMADIAANNMTPNGADPLKPRVEKIELFIYDENGDGRVSGEITIEWRQSHWKQACALDLEFTGTLARSDARCGIFSARTCLLLLRLTAALPPAQTPWRRFERRQVRGRFYSQLELSML